MKLYIHLECQNQKEDCFILNRQTGEINVTKFFFACSDVIKDAYYDALQKERKWNKGTRARGRLRLCAALDVVEQALILMHPDNNIKISAYLYAPLSAPHFIEVNEDAEE